MHSLIRSYIVILFCFFYWSAVEAAHIIGGDVTYECLGVDSVDMTTSYRITFNMYRDCQGGGAAFEDPARIGIFNGTGATWSYFQTHQAPIFETSFVSNDLDNPCIIVPPDVCVQRAKYIFVITLPHSNNSYLIAYQRCCRNVSINNILDAGNTGAAFQVEISPFAQTSCNDSPTFNKFPPIVICNGEDVNFDHSATDNQGDQITYEFCAPLTAGGTDGATTQGDPNSCTGVTPNPVLCGPPFSPVIFQLPTYSSVAPMAGNPVVSINPNTGQISGIPEINGQFVVGVCAIEYRNGVEIGRIRRDFQFNVATCEIAVSARIASDSVMNGNEFLINSCGNNTIDFNNLSTDENYIEDYYWEFDINGTLQTFTTRDVSVTFPGIGNYMGTMILNKSILNTDECKDTAIINVNVFPSITADFSYDYDTCVAGPVSFTDLSFTGASMLTGWNWDFMDGNLSNLQNPSHTFSSPGNLPVSLIVEDVNRCRDTSVQTINWFPVPPLIIIDPSAFIGCKPADIFFNNLSTPIDSTYDINWEFGDGLFGDDISPTHTYEEEGSYSISVDITSPIGCTVSGFFADLIRIVPSPIADFTFSPDEPSNFNKEISFQDQSIDANSWFWKFGDVGTNIVMNPTFNFPDTGVYQVDLVVLHLSGCADTFSQLIDIKPLVTYFVPSAFTPNNDGINDGFIGKGFYQGLQNFKMTVWNRWGEMIYYTKDPTAEWNGEKNNAGIPSPPGVYVYLIDYIGPRGERRTLKGHVTLLR